MVLRGARLRWFQRERRRTPPRSTNVSEDHRNEKLSIPLQQLPVGRWARLTDGLPRNVSHRLLDLGFVPGTRLRIIRRAPLGDPIEIEIRGSRMCFRRHQLRGFRVVVEDGPER